MNVLLVEDDLNLLDALSRQLAARGFQVICCIDSSEALILARRKPFDVILLDLNLPGMDGLTWLGHLRDTGSKTPVLVMTARAAVEDKVLGLNSGADDYLVKPFDVEELFARLKALIRRSQGVEEYRCGAIRLVDDSGHVFKGALPLDVPPRELKLLRALMVRLGHAVTREDLHQIVFDAELQKGSDALEILVHRLRKRLAGTGALLVTVRGIGYYLVDEVQAEAGG